MTIIPIVVTLIAAWPLLVLTCVIIRPFWNERAPESMQLMVPVITSKDGDKVKTTRIESTSPLHWAVSVYTRPATMAAWFLESFIRVMVAAGCGVDARTQGMTTPLHLAAYFGNLAGLTTLLEAGADVDAGEHSEKTPLFFAAQQGHVNAVKALLAWKADVNKPADDGTTPLYMAVRMNKRDVVDALLTGGADVSKTRKKVGDTPLYMAAQEGHYDVVKRLLRVSEIDLDAATTINRETPLWVAAECGHADVVGVLLDAGADHDARDTLGRTPLMIAKRVLKLDVEDYAGAEDTMASLEVVQALLKSEKTGCSAGKGS